MSTTRPTVRVAVVGSGLAALTAAYRLAKDPAEVDFEVHVFEKSSKIGMDASSMTVNGTERRVDVPMRSFQGGYYPRLIKFYEEIGAAYRTANFSYSFSELRNGAFHTTLIYNGVSSNAKLGMPSSFHLTRKSGLGFGLDILDALFLLVLSWATFLSSAFVVALNQLRLIALCSPWLRIHPTSTVTFRDWADAVRPTGLLSNALGLEQSWLDFVHLTLVPLFSAVCTAGAEDVLNHPAYELLEYCWLTLGTDHYVATHGVRDVVARLIEPVKHVHLSTCVEAFHTNADGTVSIRAATLNESGTESTTKTFGPFAHVILATQANQAGSLLEELLKTEPANSPTREDAAALLAPLKHFHYVQNIVCNHTDTALLPALPDRRDLNLLRLPSTSAFSKGFSSSELCVPTSFAMATQILPGQSYDASNPLLQTTNPIIPPRRETVLSIARLQRAVLTPAAKTALPALATCTLGKPSWSNLWTTEETWSLGPAQGRSVRSGARTVGLWCCGSYAHGGIPLLEGCVVSATNVAAEIASVEQRRLQTQQCA